jgi:uncharacterized membrane protein YraQ (UPF0718 family)
MSVSTLAPATRRTVSPRALATTIGIVAAAIVAGRLADVGRLDAAQSFVLIFTAIVVEAVPFILIGAMAGALIEVYVPEGVVARVAGKRLGLQMPVAVMGGLAFPVCDCGSVPVARRLIARGLHPAAGLAFMFAAPVFNPIVLMSTFIAYRGRDVALQMVVGRAGLVLVVALAAGWALGADGTKELLRPRPDDLEPAAGDAATRSRKSVFVDHLAADFFFMGKFLVIGAALSAAIQTALPQSLVSGVARTPVVGTLALMAIAFIASLCSEADAFVAVSFTQFPLGSQLAFLVFGPVADAKLAMIYSGTFRQRFVPRLLLIVTPVVLAGALWFEAIVR